MKNKRTELQELKRKEKKILGPQKIADGTWKKRRNEDLNKYSDKVTDRMRKEG